MTGNERAAAGVGPHATDTPGVGSRVGMTPTPAATAAARKKVIGFAFPAPTRPWSTNQRVHWTHRATNTKAWRLAAAIGARRVGPLEGRWQVQVTIPFDRGGRRDPMNYVGTVVKAAVDGMVDAGLWPDDTPDYVQVVEPRLVVDKAGDVAVTLRAIGADQ